MIAASPHFSTQIGENRDFEYILLGDLRQILEEPSTPLTSRWLIATLDMILVGRPQFRQTVYLPVNATDDSGLRENLLAISLMEKLRRLRDRAALRAGYTALASEVREQLRDYMLDRTAAQSTGLY